MFERGQRQHQADHIVARHGDITPDGDFSRPAFFDGLAQRPVFPTASTVRNFQEDLTGARGVPHVDDIGPVL